MFNVCNALFGHNQFTPFNITLIGNRDFFLNFAMSIWIIFRLNLLDCMHRINNKSFNQVQVAVKRAQIVRVVNMVVFFVCRVTCITSPIFIFSQTCVNILHLDYVQLSLASFSHPFFSICWLSEYIFRSDSSRILYNP